jgi:hypothetical protein
VLTAGVLAKTGTPAIAEDTSNIRNDISSDKDDHSMETPHLIGLLQQHRRDKN